MLRCGSNYEHQPACKEDTGVAPGEALNNEDTVQHHLPPIRNAPTDTGPGLLSRKAQPSRDPTWSEWVTLPAVRCLSFGTFIPYVGSTGWIKIDGKISVLNPGGILYTEGRRYGCVRLGSGERVY